MFLLVPAYPGCPGQTAVKWLLLLLWLFWGKLCQDGCGVHLIVVYTVFIVDVLI